MNDAPISVVIPSYNAGRYVVEAIESVLEQTLAPRQIILVDDGSIDDTAARLRPYISRVECVFQRNRGVSAARNRGIELAREPFVAFLDADDVWHPRKTQLQMEAFRRRPELGILSAPTYDWPSDSAPVIGDLPELPISDVSWERMAVKNRMNTSAIIVRREVLQRVGPFDVNLQGPEDRDLWLRILEVAPGASLEVPLSGYRITPGGISQNAVRCRDGMLRILRKLDTRGAWQGKPLLRRKAYGYVNHACTSLFSDSGQQAKAMACLLKSLAWYPFPFHASEVATRMERPKRAVVLAMRLARLRRPARGRRTGQPTSRV